MFPASIWAVADAIPGCLFQVEAALLYMLAHQVGPGGRVAEIGSWQGRSTVVIGRGLVAPDTQLHTIDDHRGVETEIGKIDSADLREKFEANLDRAAVAHKIIHHAESSKSAGAAWNILLDLLFIDGDHSAEGVKTDIALFVPHVKPGGWVAFHDAIRPSWPEVFPVARAWMLEEPRGIAQMLVAGSVLTAKLAAAGEPPLPVHDLRRDLDLAWRTVREWKKGDIAGKYRAKTVQAWCRWKLQRRGKMIPRRFDQSESH
jgi:predicted O-methyltransferase YrrM